MNHKSSLISKFVSFSISSDIHPESIIIPKAWVVENLNLPKHQVDQKHLKQKFPHLKDVEFHFSNEQDISILIGADIPQLHICYELRHGSKNEPIPLLKSLGWVLMGGTQSKGNQINSNRISINVNYLENGKENLWKKYSYDTSKENKICLETQHRKY